MTEYYLYNDELSFVFERTYNYNRPMYYDKSNMKDNNDNEYFDFKKSEITETRNYFFNNNLIKQIKNDKIKEDKEKESKRIKNEFNWVLKTIK